MSRDPGLKDRLLKYEGNNQLRVQAFVVALSKASDDELQAIAGLKMCNKRRAAERVIAWRKANPNFSVSSAEHRTPKTQADHGKPRGKSDFSGRPHRAKRTHRPVLGHGTGTECAGSGYKPPSTSGQQHRAASAMSVVIHPSTPCRLGLAAMHAEHRRLCAQKGIRTRSFVNAAAVPFPYTEGSSGMPLPSIGSGSSERLKGSTSGKSGIHSAAST